MKKYVLFILTLMMVSIGDSLCFKASVGVSPYEALALTFNYMSHIKVGTLTLFVNACMIILQIILSKQLKIKYSRKQRVKQSEIFRRRWKKERT